MSQQGSSCYIDDLKFHIEGAIVTAKEMGDWVASIIPFNSEYFQESYAHAAAHAIFDGVGEKVEMAKAQAEHARVRRLWVSLHPPNHAGFYYCHIGGEWLHESMAQLEHIVPGSVRKINTEVAGWDDGLRMACGPHNFNKGSSIVESATLEIAPPDVEC